MGADLYIESVHQKQQKTFDPLFADAVAVRDAVQQKVSARQRSIRLGRIEAYLKSDDGKAYVKDDYLGIVAKLRTMMPLQDEDDNNGYVATAQHLVSLFYNAKYYAGYFRDSYNGTIFLKRINLSWWQDIQPLLRAGYLPLTKVKWFRDQVEHRALNLPTVKELRKDRCEVKRGELKLWHEFFQRQRADLLAFLNKCLELKERPRMSL